MSRPLPPTRAARAGLTLPELLVTIAVIGVLAAIAIQSYIGLQAAARGSVARDTLSLLNRAVLHFNQSNWDLVYAASPGSTADELAILRTLQWRDPRPGRATPGSPYVATTFPDAVSTSSGTYRLRWNGRMFELLPPGQSGSGLIAADDTPGSRSAYTFAENYQPIGPQ